MSPERALASVVLVCLCITGGGARAASHEPRVAATSPIVAVDSIAITVSDVDRAVEFYSHAIVVSDMDAAYGRLREFHVGYASSGPQRLPDWNPNAAGIRAFYFRDPDEHNLEVLQFPAGKGLPKWHVHDGRTFLGIDHTAIVIADTAASLAFYRDTLGLKVVGTSENYGTEQEHLNNVLGAHLQITSLRAPRGPGIEFLQYLAPLSGRPAPADTHANDLWSWQIIMTAARPRELERMLHDSHFTLVSSNVGRVGDGALDWEDAFIARDPDGHTALISSGKQQ